jgi:hypothetical protein
VTEDAGPVVACQAKELNPAMVVTHEMKLEDAADGYRIFNDKTDGCVKARSQPDLTTPHVLAPCGITISRSGAATGGACPPPFRVALRLTCYSCRWCLQVVLHPPFFYQGYEWGQAETQGHATTKQPTEEEEPH